ncbi:MAG: zinc-binding dehydrogenase [Caldilineaceae bacterium]|nr:zinc-binding dehydrogenase [Caldilineaceae bacterium]
MRAVIFREHSPSLDAYEVIEDMPVPEIGPDEVLVRVHYAAINRLDNWVRLGWRGLNLDFPHIPCSDFSGTIAQVGTAVEGWAAGQRVTANPLLWCGKCRNCLRGYQNRCLHGHILGETVRGACAEYVKIPARNLIEIPADYDLQKAAAASLVYVTAWHNVMSAGNLRAGERVLIVGAGGGVNTAALQIAKLAGAEVMMIASTAEKAQMARDQGADWVYDRSTDENWSRAVYQATQRAGVDMVVDNVGEATWASSLRTLTVGGRLVTVGGTTGYNAVVPVNLIFGKQLSIIGSTMGTQDDYQRVMTLVFQRKLDPIVDSAFAPNAFKAAMTRMMEDQQFGKILIAL